MSDGIIIALFALIGVLVAAVPSTISALTARHLATQARDHAKAAADAATVAADTLGVKNGNGDLMTMMTRSLAENMEMRQQNQKILDWQREHEDLDDQRIKDLLNRIVELSTYTHDGVHELRNVMTPIVGHVDLMWRDYMEHKLGIDPDTEPEATTEEKP